MTSTSIGVDVHLVSHFAGPPVVFVPPGKATIVDSRRLVGVVTMHIPQGPKRWTIQRHWKNGLGWLLGLDNGIPWPRFQSEEANLIALGLVYVNHDIGWLFYSPMSPVRCSVLSGDTLNITIDVELPHEARTALLSRLADHCVDELLASYSSGNADD